MSKPCRWRQGAGYGACDDAGGVTPSGVTDRFYAVSNFRSALLYGIPLNLSVGSAASSPFRASHPVGVCRNRCGGNTAAQSNGE